MRHCVVFLGACFILGKLAVVSNPSYYYGVVGLVLTSVAGCGWLMSPGTSFAVFGVLGQNISGFCLSLAVEPFPETLGGL
ncbi:NU6M oxidoreductase, partial [Catharus fuscescens]|nr:NU6M oxidoreductase [Catharus fuscescens]